jgi:hypothetical protein
MQSELPNNLKEKFPSVVMVVPDTNLIWNLYFFSGGIEVNRIMFDNKRITIYSITQE